MFNWPSAIFLALWLWIKDIKIYKKHELFYRQVTRKTLRLSSRMKEDLLSGIIDDAEEKKKEDEINEKKEEDEIEENKQETQNDKVEKQTDELETQKQTHEKERTIQENILAEEVIFDGITQENENSNVDGNDEEVP
eukprot:466985_1